MIQLGGDRAWKQFVKGDIVVSFHWVNGEPAMCLWPKVKRTLHAGAFIICLSAAHKYAKSNGDPIPDYLIPQAMEAARVMGMDLTRFTVRRIADAIFEHIPDLVRMPPEPTLKQQRLDRPVGEMVLTAGGKVIHEGEVHAPTREEFMKIEDNEG